MATCNRCGNGFMEDDFVYSPTGFCRKCYMERVAELEQERLLAKSLAVRLGAINELKELQAITDGRSSPVHERIQLDIEH